ncbi:MAG TPA: metal ABC transporter permease [Candidatus Fimivicinus intestinavium]|nr:metal ABC transporter permease [Candidatus Fimivicinus intestinavium]
MRRRDRCGLSFCGFPGGFRHGRCSAVNTIYLILDTLLPFSWMEYRFMKNALIAVLLITPLLGLLGTMAVNNKMAFFSDALGHSALTGVALGVLLGIGNDLISMIAFGVLLALIITRVKAARTASADTVISVFSSTAIALGLVILSAGGGFSKYSQYLIGDILSITPHEILLLALTLVLVALVWGLIYNRLLLLSINADLAASRGVKTAVVENIFVVLVAVVVMLSIKWVGVLLINSLLILPAAAARNLARNTRQYLACSVLIAMLCGIGGLIASFYWNTSAGATIVLLCAAVFFVTYAVRRRR